MFPKKNKKVDDIVQFPALLEEMVDSLRIHILEDKTLLDDRYKKMRLEQLSLFHSRSAVLSIPMLSTESYWSCLTGNYTFDWIDLEKSKSYYRNRWLQYEALNIVAYQTYHK